jgi:hypothetical protein
MTANNLLADKIDLNAYILPTYVWYGFAVF